jgi:hypothetical protein
LAYLLGDGFHLFLVAFLDGLFALLFKFLQLSGERLDVLLRLVGLDVCLDRLHDVLCTLDVLGAHGF